MMYNLLCYCMHQNILATSQKILLTCNMFKENNQQIIDETNCKKKKV